MAKGGGLPKSLLGPAAHPLLRYRQQGRSAALFDGEPPADVQALGQRFRPSLVDLFVALTRKPELQPREA